MPSSVSSLVTKAILSAQRVSDSARQQRFEWLRPRVAWIMTLLGVLLFAVVLLVALIDVRARHYRLVGNDWFVLPVALLWLVVDSPKLFQQFPWRSQTNDR